ncbi:MAG: methionine--tRNA ligase subunit beta [Candidatus Ratteibacteria bacterium]
MEVFDITNLIKGRKKMEIISFDDFKKIDMRTGKIISVDDHPAADKLYILQVDLGAEKRQIVAGIKPYYSKEELVGKTIIIVANLQSRAIRGVESNGMLLAGLDDTTLAVLTIDRNLKPGTKIT